VHKVPVPVLVPLLVPVLVVVHNVMFRDEWGIEYIPVMYKCSVRIVEQST
jgi:hypothetical protein